MVYPNGTDGGTGKDIDRAMVVIVQSLQYNGGVKMI